MDWGLRILSSQRESLVYYWRDEKAALVRLGPSEDFLGDLEDGLKQAAAEIGLKDVRQMFRGEGMVGFSTSYLLDLIRNDKGQKIGFILNENAAEALTEEEKRYLHFTGDNVAFIPESVNMSGKVEREIKSEEVIKAFRDLLKVGVHSVVVSLKNSWMFPEHERQIRDILKTNYPSRYLGGVPVYISSDFEMENGRNGVKALTMLSAYVQATMRKYFFDVEQKLKTLGYRGGLFLGNRYGGLSRWDKTRAIDTADSVFRSAMAGAEVLAGRLGIRNALALNVDDYSTSLGIIKEGAVSVGQTGKVLGVAINAPSAEALNIPAGIKSKIRISSGKISFDNDLKEGISLEDMNRILGYMPGKADKNLVGRFKETIAGPLGRDIEEAALIVRHSFVSMVSEQILACLSGRGIDASGCTLLPSNGNAGAYCWDVGKSLKTNKVYVFSCSDYLGAFGLGSMGLRHFYQTMANIPLDSDFCVQDVDGLSKLVENSFSRANLDMTSEGLEVKTPIMALKLISGVNGEEPVEFAMPIEDSGRNSIQAACKVYSDYLKVRFRDKLKDRKINLAGIGLMASLPVDGSLQSPITPEPKAVSRKEKNMAYWEGEGNLETHAYPFSTLKAGERIAGPVIVEGRYSYYLVPPKAEMEITEDLNGILEVK